MKRNVTRKSFLLCTFVLFAVFFALPASAKTAMDEYTGKWIKMTTQNSFAIPCDKGAVIEEGSIKKTGKAIEYVDYFTPEGDKPYLNIMAAKAGNGTVSFKYTYKGKTKKYTLKVKISKYVCPVKKIAFGKYQHKATKNSLLALQGYTMTVAMGNVKKKYAGTFTVTPKSGWEVKKIVKETEAGKKSKVKNKAKVNVNGRTVFIITMMNKKTKELSLVYYTYYGMLGA